MTQRRLYRGDITHEVRKFKSGDKIVYRIEAHKKYDSEIEKALTEDCRIFKIVEKYAEY